MLEGVEMGSMNGGAVLGWRGEEGAPRDAQCFSELSKELDLSSLGEAAHLDSFAPATLVYAHLISKDWFLKIKPANTSPRRKTRHTLCTLKVASLKYYSMEGSLSFSEIKHICFSFSRLSVKQFPI